MSISPASSRSGSALIQVVAIIGAVVVLTALAFPLRLSFARRLSTNDCLSNEKQLMTALFQYAQDYNGCMPASVRGKWGAYKTWDELIYPRLKHPSVFKCPADTTKGTRSYSFNDQHNRVVPTAQKFNGAGVLLATINPPSKYVAICDWHDDQNYAGGSAYATMYFAPTEHMQYHNGRTGECYAFFDGHAEYRAFGTTTNQYFWYHVKSHVPTWESKKTRTSKHAHS